MLRAGLGLRLQSPEPVVDACLATASSWPPAALAPDRSRSPSSRPSHRSALHSTAHARPTTAGSRCRRSSAPSSSIDDAGSCGNWRSLPTGRSTRRYRVMASAAAYAPTGTVTATASRMSRRASARVGRTTWRSTTDISISRSTIGSSAGGSPPAELEPEGKSETIVDGLAGRGQSPVARAWWLGGGDSMFVSIGSATNSCQQSDRHARSPGHRSVHRARAARRHLAVLRDQGGTDVRVRTPLRDRHAESTRDHDPAWHRRAVRGHSRSRPARRQLGLQRRAERGESGGGAGGGAGRRRLRLAVLLLQRWRTRPRCSRPSTAATARRSGAARRPRIRPFAFPAHWAPLALAFYPGDGFGEKYKDGLFVAFHGSWNRAPAAAGGLSRGVRAVRGRQADGSVRDIRHQQRGPTDLRASGVAVGNDGALYISADQNGKIWKVVTEGLAG